MDLIQNRTFDEINVGDSATLLRTLSKEDIVLFAAVSGDVNPTHVDEEFARSEMFHRVIGHGMWGASLISTVLGTELPGPGAIYVSQSLHFRKPVAVGDVVRVTVRAAEKDAAKKRIRFDCQCVNQSGDVVIEGVADVLAPKEKVSRPRMALPEVRVFDRSARYRELMRRAENVPAVRAAVVHPVDIDSLAGCLEAAKRGLIIPTFVGPRARIRAAAEAGGFDADRLNIVATEHSHAAAAKGVSLARGGHVDVLIKGALASAEFMAAVAAPHSGLQTSRCMSHVCVLDVPTYPRPLLLTDAELHPYPTLDEKRDIVQNAIELAHAIGIAEPKVAILAASDQVSPRLESTMHAAALCKMAQRRQITGGVLEGPMSFDTAVSEAAAGRKGVMSAVAGKADILIVPDLEAGRMLVQQLEYLVDAQSADLILGGRVPIICPGIDDTLRTREAACALAALLVGTRPARAEGAAPARASESADALAATRRVDFGAEPAISGTRRSVGPNVIETGAAK
ncbi:MAG: enoyl-CoA hydratase [Planctomycetota bacterium]|nr:MAG: enoyl-CoA hydratase [Planctomycetota bacterium]